MKNMWNFFIVHLFSDLRNRKSLFWSLLFPVLLLVMLVLVFSNLGTTSSIDFKILLINEAKTGRGVDYASMVVKAFSKISRPNANAIFSLRVLSSHDLQKAVKDVLYSKVDAVVIIPKNFNVQIMRAIVLEKMGIPFSHANLEVLYLPNSASSSLARSAIQGVMNEINELIFPANKKLVKFTLRSETLGENAKAPTYTDFVTPGILVVGAFTTALFLIAPKMAFMKHNDVMKRYASTPVSSWTFFLGFGFSKVFLMLCQYIILGSVALLFFRSSIHLFSLEAVAYYLFTCIVYVLMGFVIAFFSSSVTAVTALTSVLNLPMEFLAGIYFPLFNLPWYIETLVKINPLWYATNAMRQLMGVGTSPTSWWWNILVPSTWGVLSLLFLSTRKIWKEG